MKYLEKIFTIATGFILLALGVYTLINYKLPFVLLRDVVIIALVSSSIVQVFSIVIKKLHEKNILLELISPIGSFLLASFLFFAPSWFWGIIPISFGIWSILNAIISAINLFVFKSDGVKNWYIQFIPLVINIIFGILFTFNPLNNFVSVGIIIGIYFIMYGLSILSDAIVPYKFENSKNGKRKFRMVLPVFIAAFIPQKVLSKINEKLQNGDDFQTADKDADNKKILELFVHLSEGTAGGFGHCDVCFDDTVISYGCYDASSNRLFGALSDGVMAFTPREAYIKNCIDYEGKILIGFSINVSENQIQAIRNQILGLKENMIRWYSDLELDEMNKPHKESDFTDAASQLYKAANAKFYKFKKGEFKTYFVVGMNCVKVADYIVGATGIANIGNGIITPGTYYSFLDEAYKKNNSIVAAKNVYTDYNN